MNVFRTLVIPASLGPMAVRICDALGYPDKGMFTAKVADGAEPADGQPDTRPVVGYISSGIVDDGSLVMADAATLHAAVSEVDPSITLADCQAFKEALDETQDEPHARMAFVKQEIKLGATASPWVQPTGAHNSYAKDAVVSYGGKSWRSLHDANVQAPGVSGWRLLWASTQAAPQWVQPTGSHDAYQMGAIVTHKGQTWKNTGSSANVWEPGVFGWVVV